MYSDILRHIKAEIWTDNNNNNIKNRRGSGTCVCMCLPSPGNKSPARRLAVTKTEISTTHPTPIHRMRIQNSTSNSRNRGGNSKHPTKSVRLLIRSTGEFNLTTKTGIQIGKLSRREKFSIFYK